MESSDENQYDYRDCPRLLDVDEAERKHLLILKMSLCERRVNFSGSGADLQEDEDKYQTLVELVDYVTRVQGVFTPDMYGPLTSLAAANLFRALPVGNELQEVIDSEGEIPAVDPAWHHLELVYELFRRFVMSPDTLPRLLAEHIDERFLLQLLDLFDSGDPREREYLKTILHRIYGKLMPLRPFIRKSITNIFQRYVYETQRFNGIAELLEILGSVINGFALPLRQEHKEFLRKGLVPLHMPAGMPSYHVQLSFCVAQFIQKDPGLAVDVIRGLCKYWPRSHSKKEIMFLNQLEELLEVVDPDKLAPVLEPLFKRIQDCLCSQHFQVAERALFLWNNDYFVNVIMHHREVIMPIVLPALRRNAQGHWNRNVQALSGNVEKLLAEMDSQLYDACAREIDAELVERSNEAKKSKQRWAELERSAGLSVEVSVRREPQEGDGSAEQFVHAIAGDVDGGRSANSSGVPTDRLVADVVAKISEVTVNGTVNATLSEGQ